MEFIIAIIVVIVVFALVYKAMPMPKVQFARRLQRSQSKRAAKEVISIVRKHPASVISNLEYMYSKRRLIHEAARGERDFEEDYFDLFTNIMFESFNPDIWVWVLVSEDYVVPIVVDDMKVDYDEMTLRNTVDYRFRGITLKFRVDNEFKIGLENSTILNWFSITGHYCPVVAFNKGEPPYYLICSSIQQTNETESTYYEASFTPLR